MNGIRRHFIDVIQLDIASLLMTESHS
jgi:hypothetical protein